MANKELKIELKGSFEDQENLRFSDFLNELRAIEAALGELDSQLVGSDKRSVYYRIISVSHSSPTLLTLDTKPYDPELDNGDIVLDRFISSWDSIRRGHLPEDFNQPILAKFKEIVAIGTTHHIETVAFNVDGNRVEVTSDLEREIESLIGSEEEIVLRGNITGKIESLYLHRQRNFRIYPIAGPTSVLCHFPEALLADVIRAIQSKAKVSVIGDLKYKDGGKYPSEVIATNIEIFKHDKDLPKLSDLHGIAPDATGDLSSEEFIRKLRDEEW